MRVALVDRCNERVRAMTRKELALIEVEYLPSDRQEQRCPRPSSVDVLAGDGDCVRSEVAWHCEQMGLRVALRVGDSGSSEWIAPLPEAVDVFVRELRQVAVLIEPDGARLGEDGLVEDVEGVRSAPTPNADPNFDKDVAALKTYLR
jgi:hypothetical protein